MSEVQLSPDEIVEALPKYIIPEKAGSTKATIVFDLSGEHAGKWWVKIHDGAAESGKGDPPEAANHQERDGDEGQGAAAFAAKPVIHARASTLVTWPGGLRATVMISD